MHKAIMVYKSLNGLASQYLRDKFVHHHNISNYSLRDAENKLVIPLPRTNYMKNTVSVIPELSFGTAYLLKCGRPMTLVLFGSTARITLTGSSYCKSLSHSTHEKQICLISMYCLYVTCNM